MLPIAILAGGQALRLRPTTATVPKSLIPIAGEPFLAHQLRLLRRSGLEHVVLCVGFLGEQIQDFAGDGSAFGLHVEYVSDGPSPLGTAGAIRKALPLLGNTFFVLYGDSYLACDYRDVQNAFAAANADALMTVVSADDRPHIEAVLQDISQRVEMLRLRVDHLEAAIESCVESIRQLREATQDIRELPP